ncbi:MAG: hypothetical protein H6709_14755 [Kofleriaceae bacterium]|nr:hypothetical protein [Kofleriaceae bacterium]
MADDPRKPASAPVSLRIKVRFNDLEAFVDRFAPYVGRAGLFLRHKAPKPVGTEVRFELRLASDQPVMVGMGVVRWSREVDPERPHRPPGMAIEFTRVTKDSREVILRILELRRRLGMKDGPRGLPDPPDDDSIPTTAASASAIAAETRAASPAAPERPRRATAAPERPRRATAAPAAAAGPCRRPPPRHRPRPSRRPARARRCHAAAAGAAAGAAAARRWRCPPRSSPTRRGSDARRRRS